MLPNLRRERQLWKKGFVYVIGVDEVGRGAFAGPIVACAAVVISSRLKAQSLKLRKKLIRDSKSLAPHLREAAFSYIKNQPMFRYALARVMNTTIDRIGVGEANRIAMRNAVMRLVRSVGNIGIGDASKARFPFCVLIDGREKLKTFAHEIPIVKGDSRVFTIACASIIAKVTRDQAMVRLNKRYPSYAWEKNKGYGTKVHQLALRKFGPNPYHRRSFIRSFLDKKERNSHF